MVKQEWEWILARAKVHSPPSPMLDVGGIPTTTLVDYLLPGKRPLFEPKGKHLWSQIHEECDNTHELQSYAKENKNKYGLVVSTSTLEHVKDLFSFFPSVRYILKTGGWAILTTVEQWPIHGDPEQDYWRFTEAGLKALVEQSGLLCIGTFRQELVDKHIIVGVEAQRI